MEMVGMTMLALVMGVILPLLGPLALPLGLAWLLF